MWTWMTFDPIRSMAIELVGLFKNLDQERSSPNV